MNEYEGQRKTLGLLVELLKDHPRVILAGGPRTGKSTLAIRAGERFGREVHFGDALIDQMEWSDCSQEVSEWFDKSGDWIIEGVVTPRALRKWFARNPGKKLDATIVWMNAPIQVRSKGAEGMAVGVNTVWAEIIDRINADGITVIDWTDMT